MIIKYLREEREFNGKVERHPIGCIAIDMNETLNYGVSVCSKKDHFCKRVARDIAVGRMKSGKNLDIDSLSQKRLKVIRPQIDYILSKARSKLLKQKLGEMNELNHQV